MSDKESSLSPRRDNGETEASDAEPDAPEHRSRGKRRRRKKRKQAKPEAAYHFMLIPGVLLFCGMLVMIGVYFGSRSNSAEETDRAYQETLELRRKAYAQELLDCQGTGYSPWACRHFDASHFAIANKLDEFHCDMLQVTSVQCRYVLGQAKVIVTLPRVHEDNGDIRAPTTKSSATVAHSDASDDYFVSVSNRGNLELREREKDIPLYSINPLTGRLSDLQK